MSNEPVTKEEWYNAQLYQKDMINNLDKKQQAFMEQNKEEHSKIFTAIEEMKIMLAELPKKILDEGDEKYASKDSVSLLQRIVYGMIGAILLGVLYATLKNIGL